MIIYSMRTFLNRCCCCCFVFLSASRGLRKRKKETRINRCYEWLCSNCKRTASILRLFVHWLVGSSFWLIVVGLLVFFFSFEFAIPRVFAGTQRVRVMDCHLTMLLWKRSQWKLQNDYFITVPFFCAQVAIDCFAFGYHALHSFHTHT